MNPVKDAFDSLVSANAGSVYVLQRRDDKALSLF